jgi:hypothetical protein
MKAKQRKAVEIVGVVMGLDKAGMGKHWWESAALIQLRTYERIYEVLEREGYEWDGKAWVRLPPEEIINLEDTPDWVQAWMNSNNL